MENSNKSKPNVGQKFKQIEDWIFHLSLLSLILLFCGNVKHHSLLTVSSYMYVAHEVFTLFPSQQNRILSSVRYRWELNFNLFPASALDVLVRLLGQLFFMMLLYAASEQLRENYEVWLQSSIFSNTNQCIKLKMLFCVLQQKERRGETSRNTQFTDTLLLLRGSFNGSANNFSKKIIESNDDSCITWTAAIIHAAACLVDCIKSVAPISQNYFFISLIKLKLHKFQFPVAAPGWIWI